jgi:N-terminal domain of anti-restriction factor ArdC
VKEANLTHRKDRNMKSADIQQATNRAIEQLTAALNQGRSETLTDYLAAMARFHRYSMRNIMLIASQKPAATRVAGFRTWHRLGRFVKKGEKGIFILAPIMRRKIESPATDETAMPASFRLVCVFDISQTGGRELPAIGGVAGDPGQYREHLVTFVGKIGIGLEYSNQIAPALGTSSGGKITLLPGRAPAEEFLTLAHELAHELMHRTERRSTTSKCVRETEAEAVAFVVSRAIGLETISAAKDYIELYKGDANLLAESLALIQRTACEILEGIGEDEETFPPS